jgi:hypothetical protein
MRRTISVLRRFCGRGALIGGELARRNPAAFPPMAESISNLHRHMIEDMKILNMAVLTQAAYVRAVKNFAAFNGKAPDKLSFEDVRIYHFARTDRRSQPLRSASSASTPPIASHRRAPPSPLRCPIPNAIASARGSVQQGFCNGFRQRSYELRV